jgi:sterol desaturase/sphingolipid hydroxylase (fatty acid hydroxylase superfamily)
MHSAPEAGRGVVRAAAYPVTMLLVLGLHAAMTLSGAAVTLSAYAAVLLGAVAVGVLERLIPYERRWRPGAREAGSDLLYMVAVQMALPPLLTLIAGVTLLRLIEPWEVPLRALWPRELPVPAQALLMLLAADFLRYWLHVAAHRTPLLWRLHAVHHSPHRLYWLNVGRFHPLEKALQYLLDTLPFIVLGVGAEVLAGYLVFYAVNGFFQHSNVDARYGPLNWVVSSAQLHRWHHSREVWESDHNYGNNLILWDVMFGTRFLPRARRVGELGLRNRAYPQGFLRQMTAPLVPGLDQHSPSPVPGASRERGGRAPSERSAQRRRDADHGPIVDEGVHNGRDDT